jgi:VWFA-related protein
MRKIAAIVLLLSPFIFCAQGTDAQTRPRRVGSTASAPPPVSEPTTTTTTTQSSPTRPPVLGGANRGNETQGATPADTSTGNDPQDVDEGDVVRVNTTLVTVPVSVLDRDGKYIPNLRQNDFRIFEEGVEQDVAYFAAVEKPFTVALVLDMSGSTRNHIEEIQDAAISFVNQLRSDDQVLVIAFSDRINVLTEATSDRNTLRNAIRRASSGDGTKLYDAVDFIINERLNRIQGRKAIVLFTDGVDTTSRKASYQSTVRDAEELDALIYSVEYNTINDIGGGGGGNGGGGISYPLPRRGGIFRLPFPFPVPIMIPGGGGGGGRGGGRGGGGGNFPNGSNGSSSEDYARADRYLHDLANKSGARVYRAESTSNLSQAFGDIAEELRRQYSIGYYPKATAQSGQRRNIKVRVNRPNLVVRARDSYISGASNNGGNTAQGSSSQQPQQPSAPTMRRTPFATNHAQLSATGNH